LQHDVAKIVKEFRPAEATHSFPESLHVGDKNDQGNRAADHHEDARITENLSNSLRVESPEM
jgi:hypothetical protein